MQHPKGELMSKNWQTVTKRERERAVELKRTQKRERKQAAAAEKAARKNGTWIDESAVDESAESELPDGEPEQADVPSSDV
jgi:hypothetical protein